MQTEQSNSTNTMPRAIACQWTDADGLVWRRDYASWNLRIAEIDPAGNLTRFRYTKREKIAAIIDAGGSESKYTYDCKDRLTHVFRHGVLREQYRYDTGDRLIEKLDGEGSALLKLDIGPNGLPAKRLLASGEEHSLPIVRMATSPRHRPRGQRC